MKIVVCCLFACALVVAFSGPAAAAAVPPQQALKTEQVKPGNLKGFLKDSKGKPFADVELTVVNEKGEVVQKAVTNANGEYLFKDLPEGNYVLKVAGKEAFKLEVTPNAAVGTVQARLPAAARSAATGALVPASLTTLEWTLVIVGGVAVAVAVPAIVHNNTGGNHHHVSP